MISKIIQFDQVQIDGEGAEADGQIVNETPVDVAADGESVIFTLPDGTRWGCDQEPLAAVVTG